MTIDDVAAPSAYVFVTNHPYHHDLAGLEAGYQCVAAGFKIPTFGRDAGFRNMRDWLKSKESHADMYLLAESLRTHGDIPSTFDGELPEFAFEDGSGHPRLEIGRWYLIPDVDGQEVAGELCEGVVFPERKECIGVYSLSDGRTIMATAPLTDAEVVAFERSPDTFFGVLHGSREEPVESVIDAFELLYETYRDTPKDRLLEFIASWPHPADLKHLSQTDLAIEYCEQLAIQMWSELREKEVARGATVDE